MGRTDPHIFDLPVKKIREGYYTDQYFNYTKSIMEASDDPTVLMQVFQKKDAVLAGIDEAIAVLKLCSGSHFDVELTRRDWINGWDQLEVYALNEGDRVSPFEPVMQIVGPYSLFAHLETVYLGILARRTMIATNVSAVIEAANEKPVWYFPARHDHWLVQTGDGFAAHAAGVAGVSTDSQANWWGGKGMGTVPHALIAACNGDTVEAALRFGRKFGEQMNISTLVDFDNDCAATALQVAGAFQEEGLTLWGVRLDTSESLVDKGIWEQMGQFKPTGVNEQLVRHVRSQLDSHGFHDVKIIVSGGFNVDKIEQFESNGVPVDAYGVGASLIRGDFAYTADVVKVNGKSCSKVGRNYIHSDRLERVF